MKNKSIFKTFLLILLVTVGLTWIIPGTITSQETGEMVLGTVNPEGLLGIFGSFDIVGQYFFQNILLVLIIGMFYGVINKTGAYKELVEETAKKFKKNKSLFVVFSVLFFTLIPALTNLYFLMFLFVPFFMNVLREMGYTKNVMLLTTVGSILVGFSSQLMNGLFVQAIQSTTNPYLWVKILFLVLSIALICVYVLVFSKDKEKEDYDSMLELEDRKKSKSSSKALKVIFIVLFVFFLLGFVNWNFAFFPKMHEAIMGVKLGKFDLFSSLFGNFNAFGSWWTGEFYTMLFLASILVSLIYKLTLDEIADGLASGIKKFVVPAMMVGMMVLVTIFTINSGFVGTILKFIVSSGNAALIALGSIIGIPFIADPNYVANYSMPMVLSSIKSANADQIALITQIMYGLTMLLAPTSAIMVAGMAYLEKDYKTWFKYVWKLAVALFALAFIVIILANLINF